MNLFCLIVIFFRRFTLVDIIASSKSLLYFVIPKIEGAVKKMEIIQQIIKKMQLPFKFITFSLLINDLFYLSITEIYLSFFKRNLWWYCIMYWLVGSTVLCMLSRAQFIGPEEPHISPECFSKTKYF